MKADSVAYEGQMAGKPKEGKKVLSGIRISEGAGGGHIIEHHFTSEGGFGYHEPEVWPFGAGEGQKMMDHVAKHMKVKMGSAGTDPKVGKEEV